MVRIQLAVLKNRCRLDGTRTLPFKLFIKGDYNMAAIVKDFLKDVVEDFAKDSDKERSGVWMTYKRFQYLVARAHRNNTKFMKLMEERMRPYQWALDRGNFDALREVANEVLQGVYAETILLGIRRVPAKDADGNALPEERLPYTPEDGVALFRALPDFWDETFKFAGASEIYAPSQVKADSGN